MNTRRTVAVVCSVAFVMLSSPGAFATAEDPCGLTTLDATVTDRNEDGVLECGPGDEIVLRDDVASRNADGKRSPLMAFLLLADLQIGDEELTLPSRTDWREHPAMLPHMANAQIKAANRIVSNGSPVFDQPYDMAFALGDLADNAQYNETRLVIDLMDGHRVVDPDSGADGYDGEKRTDPRGAGDLTSPVRGESILDLANEPFYAEGLRTADGSPVPWYAVHGNHDSKVMGGIPHEHADWRQAADRWATGDKKIFRLNLKHKNELSRIRRDAPQEEAAFWMRIFELVRKSPTAVGDVRTIAADDHRHILSRAEWIEELHETTGAPRGHGFGSDSRRCPDVYPNGYARRACYAFDHEDFRFIVLDDNALEGYTTGSIDTAQFRWMEEQLIGASRSYFDASGKRVRNPDAEDRYVVVLSHHTTRGMTNDGTSGKGFNELQGGDLKKLLLRFPNVVMHANGHSHSNRLWAHKSKRNGTRYWEINTASVADHPHNSRSVEVVRNADGTLSIFGVLFETGAYPNPRHIHWSDDDPTDESAIGEERSINEDWLASVGMEEAARDVRDYRYGKDENRNVELVLPDPLVATAAAQQASTTGGLGSLGFGVVVAIVVATACGGAIRLGVLAMRVRPLRDVPDRSGAGVALRGACLRPRSPAPTSDDDGGVRRHDAFVAGVGSER